MNKKYIGVLLLLVMLVCGTRIVHAEETKNNEKKEVKVENPQIPYNVVTKIPDNQINKSATYYDLLVKPGEKQNFIMELSNMSQKEIELKITPTTAKTAKTGVVSYLPSDQPMSATLTSSFQELVSKEQIVKIPAKSQKEVTFTANIPEKKFKGIILGGFVVQEVSDKENDKKDTSKKDVGVQIENKYSMIVAAQLRMDKEVVKQNFSLGKVTVGNYGGYYSLLTELNNDSPNLIGNYSFEAKVKKKSGKEVHSWRNEKFEMAPNSVFVLPETISPDDLPAGDYTLSMSVYSGEKKEKWELSKAFSVDSKERQAIIDEAVDKGTDNSKLWYMAIIVGVIIIALLVVLILLSIRKNKETKPD